MSQSINVAKQLTEAFNAMDASALAAILHEDAEHVHYETRTRGREKIIDRFRTEVFPRFRRITFSPVAFYEDHHHGVVVVEYQSAMTPVKGSAYANSGVFIVKTEVGGKIRSLIEYFDTDKVRRNVE